MLFRDLPKFKDLKNQIVLEAIKQEKSYGWNFADLTFAWQPVCN